MSIEDQKKGNGAFNVILPVENFNYDELIHELSKKIEMSDIEKHTTIPSYKISIIRETQNYRSRVMNEREKRLLRIPGWEDTVTDLVCLAGVVIDNFDKLENIDEYRELYQIFLIANMSHKTVNEEYVNSLRKSIEKYQKIIKEPEAYGKTFEEAEERLRELEKQHREAEEQLKKDKAERLRATEAMRLLVEQSIPRYAYLLDLTEEQFRKKMAEKKGVFKRTQTSIIKEEGGLIIGRNLNLRQSGKQPERMVPRGKIIPITAHPKEEPLDYIRRTIEEESNLKRHLAYLLKKSYNNIREFEAKYQKFKNYRTHVRDIAKTINPILRNEKIRKMEEHLFKLERYHRTITALYNNMYQVLLNDAFEVSPSELIQVESLFLLYESITSMLSNSIGDLPITTMERRRLRLQEQIDKYNEYIEQVSSGDQPVSKRV